AGRAAPVDGARLIPLMRGAVLPELIAQPSPAAAMRAKLHRCRKLPRRCQQRRQDMRHLLGAAAQAGRGVLGRGYAHAAASIRVTVSVTPSISRPRSSPRARAAKDSAMRWLITG